jgi:hypothetical protein
MDAEELLLHDVRGCSDGALEDLALLEERRLDGLVAVTCGKVERDPFQSGEGGSFGWQEVTGAPWGLASRHVGSLAGTAVRPNA